MHRLVLPLIAFGSFFVTSADAQVVLSGAPTSTRPNDAFGPPNLYGTSWGVAGFGTIRTYSNFASPYGAGYNYGHQGSYGLLPGRFGVGLWRPGYSAPNSSYGTAYGYNTFPYPYKPGGPMYGPPIGLYAPGFGPGGPSPFYAR